MDNTTGRAGFLDRRSHTTAPAIARCPHCPAELDLAELDHEQIGPGERGYTCQACRGTVVLYSAAWLDNTEVA